jgi:hypothetical protein
MDMSMYPAWKELALRVIARPAVRSVMQRTGISAAV